MESTITVKRNILFIIQKLTAKIHNSIEYSQLEID